MDALARKAHEAIGRVVTAVYNAVLANLSKLAARDTKHGAHFVLENLSALQPRIALLAGKVPDIRACRDDLQVCHSYNIQLVVGELSVPKVKY